MRIDDLWAEKLTTYYVFSDRNARILTCLNERRNHQVIGQLHIDPISARLPYIAISAYAPTSLRVPVGHAVVMLCGDQAIIDACRTDLLLIKPP